MQGRTFIRTMIDNLFVNNAICKTVIALFNFCNKNKTYNLQNLKFSQKMPLTNIESVEKNYNSRFIFDSTKISGVGTK